MVADRIVRVFREAGTVGTRRALVATLAAAVAATAAPGEAKKRRDRKRKRRQGSGKSSSSGCSNRYSEQEILGFIKKAAKKYNQSNKAMERVARCESNLDPCAVNRSGPYYGLFQFLKSTWKTTPYGNRDIYDPEAQALAAAWMWKEGRKNEWACQ